VEHCIQSEGNLFSVFFAPGPVTNFTEASDQHTQRFAAFFHGMLEKGVSLPPSAFEAWFVSTAMDDSDIERIIDASAHAAKAAAAL
jgi:glutamate-1-semialdehyde 2,1-aminomutase